MDFTPKCVILVLHIIRKIENDGFMLKTLIVISGGLYYN